MSKIESFDLGDKVKHSEFGNGQVVLRNGEGEGQKVTVKFEGGVGEKRLAVKFANLKRIGERPTLPAVPVAEAAVPGAKLKSAAEDDEDEEEVEVEDTDDEELVEEDEE